MSRKRSNKHPIIKQKKSLLQERRIMYLTLLVAIIVLITTLIALQTILKEDLSNTGENYLSNSSNGTWQFALDTSSAYVGSISEYSTGYIPTIVIIDIDGRIVHKSSGVHTKNDLLAYVKDAEKSSTKRTVAPDFSLTTFSGKQFKLSEYKGTPVILDLMAVRCPPCHSQMPELYELKKELGESVIILSIDVDAAYGQETEDDVRNTFGEYIKD